MRTIDDSLSSKVLDLVKIPCLFLVVLIHVSGYGEKLVLSSTTHFSRFVFIKHFFSDLLGEVAVPVFFCISGYLFFFHTSFSKEVYLNKLKRRFSSLFVPFVLWNFIFLFIKLLPVLFPVLSDFWLCEWAGNRNILTCLSAFWNYNNTGFPLVIPLWFVRDLMIMCLLAPIVFLLIREAGFIFLSFLFIIYVSGCANPLVSFFPLNSCSFFFFSLGAYFSINKLDIVRICYSIRHFSWLYLLFAAFVLSGVSLWLTPIVKKIGIIFGVLSLINITIPVAAVVKGETRWISSLCFFIYVIHVPWLVIFVGKISDVCLPQSSEFFLIMGYFITAFNIIIIGMLMWLFLNRFFPKMTSFLTGKRHQ